MSNLKNYLSGLHGTYSSVCFGCHFLRFSLDGQEQLRTVFGISLSTAACIIWALETISMLLKCFYVYSYVSGLWKAIGAGPFSHHQLNIHLKHHRSLSIQSLSDEFSEGPIMLQWWPLTMDFEVVEYFLLSYSFQTFNWELQINCNNPLKRHIPKRNMYSKRCAGLKVLIFIRH